MCYCMMINVDLKPHEESDVRVIPRACNQAACPDFLFMHTDFSVLRGRLAEACQQSQRVLNRPGQAGATRASMQSGSLYLGEFILGDTAMICTASSIPRSTKGSSPESQGSKPSFASITGIRL
jgi:hypothetical protein